MTGMRVRALAAFLASLVLLAACGFRLQGAEVRLDHLGGLYLAVPDDLSPFAVELRQGLARSGARLAPSAGEADVVIRVQAERTGRRVLAVSARNTPTEFEIYYNLEYSVDRRGQEVVPVQRLERERNFSFDEGQLLAKGHEEDVLREAMARDLADLVLRRLASL